MTTIDLKEITHSWSVLQTQVFVPQTETEYQKLVELLDTLIDQVGEEENHPLASLMDVIGFLIESYETIYTPELNVSRVNLLSRLKMSDQIEAEI